MLRFFTRETDDSQLTELWGLVGTLQQEKDALRAERDMWRDKFLKLTGLGDMTYPVGAPTEMGPPSGAPLGKHVSIMGLRARAEITSREKAAAVAKERAEALAKQRKPE